MPRAALVTGAASGIGRAIAGELRAAGHPVMICDLDAEAAAEAARELDASFVAVDLTDPDGCARAVDETVERLGGVDVLVNNAGFQHLDAVEDFPLEVWRRMLDLMLTAPFLLTQRAWPHLRRSGHGRVIHVGSAHSLAASPYKVGYVTAKHGLLGHMRVVALEGGPHGITCNTVCPAYVRTPLVEGQIEDQARTRGIPAEEVEARVLLENVAVKRLLEPSDVAGYVAFLASEQAWGITGSAATIDLGWTAR